MTTWNRTLVIATNDPTVNARVQIPASFALTAGIPQARRRRPAQPRRWRAWRSRRWNLWWPGRSAPGTARRGDMLRSAGR